MSILNCAHLALLGKRCQSWWSWLLPRPTPWGPHSLLPFKSLLPKQNGLFVKPVLPWPNSGVQRGESKAPRTLDLGRGLRDPLTQQSLLDLWGHT